MKNVMSALLVASVLILGFNSHAEAKSKNSKKERAKQECLSENPSLKGKALQKCIKSKRK